MSQSDPVAEAAVDRLLALSAEFRRAIGLKYLPLAQAEGRLLMTTLDAASELAGLDALEVAAALQAELRLAVAKGPRPRLHLVGSAS